MSRFRPGDRVAGATIDLLVARTALSEVYRATETETGAAVALKVISTADASTQRRLAREAQLLAEVDHPGIVQLRRQSSGDEHQILVTDWIDGETLRERLERDGPLPPTEVQRILQALAPALTHLHDRNIVHRDISASNVLVTPSGDLTLIDLGIGHATNATTLTSDDLLAGTPKYLAPEIIRGEHATPAADQYSVAVLMHELTTGASPFPQATELASMIHHQLATAPTPLDELDPSVPAPLAASVARALSKDPDDRFTSMREFARAARAVAPAESAGSGRDRRSRTLAIGAALAVVAGLGVVGWQILNDASAEPESVAATTIGAEDVSPTASPAPTTEVATATSEPRTESTAFPTTIAAPATTVAPTPTADAPPTAEPVGVVDPTWPVGFAPLVECNRLTGSDFENGSVPLDFFGNPPGREQVVESGGYGDTWALEVGRQDQFGQYAEIVPIESATSYVFRGWFRHEGDIAEAELGISLLGADSTSLEITAKTPITSQAGFYEVRLDDVPASAAIALPYLFKDASPGVLLADELVFGVAAACDTQLEDGAG